MKCRRLNKNGIEKFYSYISDCRSQELRLEPPFELLDSLEFSEAILYDIEVNPNLKFTNRYEIGQYLSGLINDDFFQKLYNDVGFWTWLTLLFFDQFCPEKKKVNGHEHYILSTGEHKKSGPPVHYRHCVRSPVFLVKKYSNIAKPIILGTSDKQSLHEMGDILEQIMSRPKILASKSCVEVIEELYINDDGLAKRGCASNPQKKKLKSGKWSKSGYGGIRRLTKSVLPRLKLAYNLEIMDKKDIISNSGKEFELWMYKD